MIMEAEENMNLGDETIPDASGYSFDDDQHPEITEDPVQELSYFVADEIETGKHQEMANAINKWLVTNHYELTPIGGLENQQGKV